MNKFFSVSFSVIEHTDLYNILDSIFYTPVVVNNVFQEEKYSIIIQFYSCSLKFKLKNGQMLP